MDMDALKRKLGSFSKEELTEELIGALLQVATRTPRTTFKCPLCGHANLGRDAMREHIKGKHYLTSFELFDGVVEVEIVGSDGETITKGLA